MENEDGGRTPASEDLDVPLGDVLRFAGWVEEARRALTEGGSFPDEPSLRSDRVRAWVRLFGSLHRCGVEGDSNRLMLAERLRTQENHLAGLATTLYENIGSLHEGLGGEERARDARGRAVSFVQVFMLRGNRVV